MKNKLASMLDPIKDHLCPDVWDENNMLRDNVRDFVINKARRLLGNDYSEIVMIGAIVGYQYNMDDDIDVNVRVPDWKLTDDLNTKRKETNGEILTGTEHPVNLFLQAIPENVSTSWEDATFGAYDVLNDKWLVLPKQPLHTPPEFYFFQELTPAKIALTEFKTLTDRYFDSVKNLSNYKNFIKEQELSSLWKYNKIFYLKRLEQLKKTVKYNLYQTYKFAKSIDDARKLEYALGWGTPRLNWRNVLYKVLEHSSYGDFFEYVKELKLDNTKEGIHEDTTY